MSEEAPQPEKPNISAALTAWRWPIVVVFVALFAMIAFVYILRTPERLIESAVKGAANFQKATITQTFTASLPEFESERGGGTGARQGHGHGIVQKSGRVEV